MVWHEEGHPEKDSLRALVTYLVQRLSCFWQLGISPLAMVLGADAYASAGEHV
jgi:hypothetical protein